MLNTIILFIIAFVFAFSFMAIVNDINRNHINISNIVIFALCCLTLIYAFTIDGKSAYDKGYEDAIHDAELVGIGQDIYQLDFNGQVHEYTFD